MCVCACACACRPCAATVGVVTERSAEKAIEELKAYEVRRSWTAACCRMQDEGFVGYAGHYLAELTEMTLQNRPMGFDDDASLELTRLVALPSLPSSPGRGGHGAPCLSRLYYYHLYHDHVNGLID
jgi:hypothetical protein